MYRIFDILLAPFMWALQGFVFEKPQETHPWHVTKFRWKNVGIKIKGDDTKATFSQSGISKHLGLYHMPIFGGLRKYVVLENKYYKKYWQIGLNDSIQTLKIYDNKIKLLVGKEGFTAYALSDGKNEIKLKNLDFGTIGDGKYKLTRLF